MIWHGMGIVWGAAHNIILIPFIALASALVCGHWYGCRKRIALLAAPQYYQRFIMYYSPHIKLIKAGLIVNVLILLGVALLRPQWGIKEETLEQQGRDVLIALDISRSMLAQDCSPNRLAYAKEKITQLVGTLACDRVGLIIFSGAALTYCPLTTDYNAFFMMLKELDTETVASGTTALDQALKQALEIIKRAPSKKHKLLILFTDGEDFSSDLAGIKQEALQLGLQIVTVGLGTTVGAPIPLYDNNGTLSGYQKDDKDNVVISRLNEGILQVLARDSGGKYLQATSDTHDITQLKQWVEQFEKEHFDDKHIQAYEERYYYFTGLGLLLLLLEWLL